MALIDNFEERHRLTLEDVNHYIASVKDWVENAQQLQQEMVERDIFPNSNWEDDMYRSLGYTIQFIPPLWKRLIAEIIDFMILFILKLYVTFVIFYNLEIPIPDKDHLIYFFDNPRNAVEMSTELALLEILYRIIACVFETYCLHGSDAATPGKLCMGLRVVYATEIIDLTARQNRCVRISPGSALGWKKSFYRAVLKNVLMGVIMFPMCFGLLLFKHNRTGYDLMVRSIVIERPQPVRRND